MKVYSGCWWAGRCEQGERGLSLKFKNSYLSYSMALFACYFSLGIFGSILSVYLGGIGKAEGDISFIISGSHLFAFAILPMVSFLHDRLHHPRRLTIAVLVLAAVSGAAFAATSRTWLLFVLHGLSMSLLQCVSPICERLCSSGRYRYGAVRVWGAVGYAVAAQAAGLIYQYTSPSFLFYLFALSTGVTLFSFLAAGPSAGERVKKRPSPPFTPAVWRNRSFLLFLAASFLFAGMTGLNSAYLPMLLVERALDVSLVGAALFLGTLMEIPLILLSARFMDRFREKVLLSASFLLLLLQFGMYGLSHTWLLPVVSCILLKSVATMLYIMITTKVVAGVVEERYMVSALGLTATVKSLGSVLFQNAGGQFVESGGIAALYLVLMGFAALGLLLSLAVAIQESRAVFQ